MTQSKVTPLVESENNIIELVNQDYENVHRKGNAPFRKVQIIIVACAIIVTAVCAFFCIKYWSNALNVSADAAAEAYGSTKDSVAAEKCQELRERGYAKGEKEYYTSNQISISINEIRETANLEVMKVGDVVYVIDDDKGTQSWLKATGTGIYTVNLAAGEYLIDDERQYVLVRAPRPELTTVNLDNTELMLVKDNVPLFNGSVGEGEERAREQRAKAQIMLLEKIKSNQAFYQNAEESSKTLIESLVRSFNSDIGDLKVDVEFFD